MRVELEVTVGSQAAAGRGLGKPFCRLPSLLYWALHGLRWT